MVPDVRRFVVISGLPGSGKTTLARRLAPAVRLPLIDKDDVLDRLFEERGVGDSAWRRRLSRESDRILQQEAERAEGAVLVSLWHVPGMAADSGTPTGWLQTLPGPLVHVHCACPPEVAATRFVRRRRHPGHLDAGSSYQEVLASLQALPVLPPHLTGRRLDVDTSHEPDINRLVSDIQRGLAYRSP